MFSVHCFMLLKIFIVMGVTYFFEFIGFILSWKYGNETVGKYFIVNNIVNALQGVLIFVVLICKKSILKKMSSQWKNWKKSFVFKKSTKTEQSMINQRSSREKNSLNTGSNHPTDIIILAGISGKYSTSSIMSSSTTVTNLSNP